MFSIFLQTIIPVSFRVRSQWDKELKIIGYSGSIPVQTCLIPVFTNFNSWSYWDPSTPVVQWLSYSPLDPRFAGSIPAGVDGFFQSVKILRMTCFGREVKPWVPCRRFTARKRTSEPKLEPLSKICRPFHALCRKRRWWPKMFKSVVKPNPYHPVRSHSETFRYYSL